MWALLSGYKTYGLVILAMVAQIVSAVKPEFAGYANTVSTFALMGTPATIRQAITTLASK